MICSKCKIFSIHLPNFDSYICEFGHVFCRTCSPKPYSRCSLCNGRIVRRAELLIEGIPKTIFHQTSADDSNQMSDGEIDIKLNMDSDSDENWSRMFEFHDSEVKRLCWLHITLNVKIYIAIIHCWKPRDMKCYFYLPSLLLPYLMIFWSISSKPLSKWSFQIPCFLLLWPQSVQWVMTS